MTQIITEARVKFHIIDKENKKNYLWEFPVNTSLEENLVQIDFLKSEIEKKIADDKKKAEEAKKAEEQKVEDVAEAISSVNKSN